MRALCCTTAVLRLLELLDPPVTKVLFRVTHEVLLLSNTHTHTHLFFSSSPGALLPTNGTLSGMTCNRAVAPEKADVNIDAQLLGSAGGVEAPGADDKVVSMEGGCICCTLKDDLLFEVTISYVGVEMFLNRIGHVFDSGSHLR